MLYMIVETFRDGDAVPVYRRLAEKGRMAPAGLSYRESWVDVEMKTCFQLMETDDPALIRVWTDRWRDLVDFSVFPVMSSADAASAVSSRR